MIRTAQALGAGLLAGLAVCAALPAQARPVTMAEKAALAQTVGAFGQAVRANDLGELVDTLPSRLLARAAASAGVEPGVLRAQMVERSRATTPASGAPGTFSMDLERTRYAELSTGEPYALIPTRALVSMGPLRAETISETLAMVEGDEWRLVRLDTPEQVELFQDLYPEFADVTFTPGTMKAVP